jgi:hypothetical protein
MRAKIIKGFDLFTEPTSSKVFGENFFGQRIFLIKAYSYTFSRLRILRFLPPCPPAWKPYSEKQEI